MEHGEWTPPVPRTSLCSQGCHATTRHRPGSSRRSSSRTPRTMEDARARQPQLLVARNVQVCQSVRQHMRHVSAYQDIPCETAVENRRTRGGCHEYGHGHLIFLYFSDFPGLSSTDTAVGDVATAAVSAFPALKRPTRELHIMHGHGHSHGHMVCAHCSLRI